MKNRFLKLLCVLLVGFVFVSSLEAHQGDQYVDGNVDIWEDSDGEVSNPSGGGGGGSALGKRQIWDIGAVVALKFSLVNKMTSEVAGLYYYAYFSPGKSSYGGAFSSKNNAGGAYNMCGLLINGETSQWCTNVSGKISYGESFFIGKSGSLQIASDSKIRNWMRNMRPEGSTSADGWGADKWYHLYDLLTADKLNVCSKAAEFNLEPGDCADANTLREAFQNMRGSNTGLQEYIIIAEPVYAARTPKKGGGSTVPYLFTTLKGLAKRMGTHTPPGKYSVAVYIGNIHAMLKTNETHGEFGPYDPSFGKEGNYLTNERWLELSDPHVGNNYNIWALNKIIKPMPVCEIVDMDEDGIDEYYGIYGQILDNEEQWIEDCTCVIIGDKYYINYQDGPVSKEAYEAECEEPEEEPVCPPKPVDYSGMVSDCEKDGTEGIIKDPEICTIINRKEENYHTDLGNSYCEIYYDEVLTFTFMDKETARAGRFFQHDVKSKYSTIQKLSTVILFTRQYASVIDYDQWEKDYKKTNDKVLNSWNKLKYWESLYNLMGDGSPTSTKSGGGPCSCCECTGEPHSTYYAYWQTGYYKETTASKDSEGNWQNVNYVDKSAVVSKTGDEAQCDEYCCEECEDGDTYCCGGCCCSCSDATSADLGYVRDEYGKAVEAYEGVLNERDKLLYAIQDCNFMAKEPNKYYKNDETLVATHLKENPYYITRAITEFTTNAELLVYEKGIMEYMPNSQLAIDYEENYTFNEGFDISTSNNEDDTSKPKVIEMGFSEADNWQDYCDGCDDELHELINEPFMKDLDYWKCTGSDKGAKCTIERISIPRNKLTEVTFEREAVHYQENDFYTQVYTGYVSTNVDDLGYWIPMDIHAYPVGLLRKTGNYGIYVEYTEIGDQNRVVKFEPGEFTCSYDVINDLAVYDCDDGAHECYDCEPSEECYPDNPDGNAMDLGVYFRTIDLSDVFPNSQYSNLGKNEPNNINVSRRVGENWTTSNAIQVITNIQRLESIEGGIFSKKPQYSVKLRPSDIKKIQKYNKTTNYQDYSFRCNGLDCTSNFLKGALKDILENKYEEFYSKDTTIKGLYNYTR